MDFIPPAQREPLAELTRDSCAGPLALVNKVAGHSSSAWQLILRHMVPQEQQNVHRRKGSLLDRVRSTTFKAVPSQVDFSKTLLTFEEGGRYIRAAETSRESCD